MHAVLDPSARSSVSRQGRGLEILLRTEDTGGALSVIDCLVPGGTAGPPLHVHPTSDETMVVLSGVLLVHIGGRTERVPAGGVAFVGRGEQHTFATPPGDDVRFLAVHVPGGFEGFHEAAATAAGRAGRPLDREELSAIAIGFDWRPAGPPLAPTGELLGGGAPRSAS